MDAVDAAARVSGSLVTSTLFTLRPRAGQGDCASSWGSVTGRCIASGESLGKAVSLAVLCFGCAPPRPESGAPAASS